MAKMYHDNSADLALIRAKKVGIIGYGSQGHAHALNLKDSGVDVRVGLPSASESRAKAQAAGLTVLSISDAAAWADLLRTRFEIAAKKYGLRQAKFPLRTDLFQPPEGKQMRLL